MKYYTLKFILLTVLLIQGCYKPHSQNRQNVLFEKIIDAGPFQITTPSNYKLVHKQGIDSQVGVITNGKIEFNFDYGWYSNSGPETYYDYVSQNLLTQHKELVLKTCDVSDNKFQKLKDRILVLQAQKNDRHPSAPDNELWITISIGPGTCSIVLPLLKYDIHENYETYNIEEIIEYNYYEKLFYPMKKEENRAGVFLVHKSLKSKLEDPHHPHMDSLLSINTYDYEEKYAKEIIKILRSVELKKDEN